jgi:hypothetical protein
LVGGALTVRAVGQAPSGAALAPAAPPVSPAPRPRLSQQALLLSVGLAGLGFALGRVVGHGLFVVLYHASGGNVERPFDFASWMLGGAIGGWFTQWALRRVEPAFGRKHPWTVAGLWAACWGLAWLASRAISELLGEFGEVPYRLPSMLALAACGAIGGYVLGALWRSLDPAVTHRQVWIVAGGWALALFLSDVVRWGVIVSQGWGDAAWLTGWGLGGLAAGLVGGGVMLWQMVQNDPVFTSPARS